MLRRWRFVSTDAFSPSKVRLQFRVHQVKQSAAPCWPTAASHFQCSGFHGPQRTVQSPSNSPSSRSVEALASALAPVAVDQHANHDDEDATQHGEQHGEKNGYAAHSFFILAHWKRAAVRRQVATWWEEGKRVRVYLTSEQFNVIHTGYGYLLFLLFLFLFTPQHRQLVQFQGNYIVVICELRMRKCDFWQNLGTHKWQVIVSEGSHTLTFIIYVIKSQSRMFSVSKRQSDNMAPNDIVKYCSDNTAISN